MTPHETAERFADTRPGLMLVDFVEVGLPCWRVLARCDVLAHKAISAIDETLMGAIDLGVDDSTELEIMLGLDEAVLETSIVGLVANRWAQDAGNGKLALTDGGRDVMTAAVEIVSREVVVPFDYDGLLRQPIFNEAITERRRAHDRGLRSVPAAPERPPDVAELRTCRQEITRLLRDLGDGRDQESQLLAIRSLDRRDPYVLPAVALVFAPLGKGRCEVAFAIDGELSVDHEVSFGNAKLLDRLGLSRRLRGVARRPLDLPGPADLCAGVDNARELVARERIRDARELADQALTEPQSEDSAGLLRAARRELSAISPRSVRPREYARLLDTAVGFSKRRLLIVSERVSAAHVDGRFIRRLRQALARGVTVQIVFREPAQGQQNAVELLRRVSSDHQAMNLEQRDDLTGEGLLVSDDRFAVLGAHHWLAQLGDADRTIADNRSVLTTDRTRIDQEWGRFKSHGDDATTSPPHRPDKPARPTGRRPRRPTRKRTT